MTGAADDAAGRLPVSRAATGGPVSLEYEIHGDPAGGRPLLLIAGLGQQLVIWPGALLRELAGRGYAVAVFDHRDVGRSTHLDGVRVDLAAIGSGRAAPPYTIADLAGDAVAVLDAAGWPAAHLLGISMGGMVAQQVALDHPERALSLTSVMSSTGSREVGRPTPGAFRAVLSAPPDGPEGAAEHALALARRIGSPRYPADPRDVRDRAVAAYRRGHDPRGVGRQFAAILGSPDRTGLLGRLRLPALVVHGAEDPLVDPSGGEATAAAIPGARLLILPGMGHDLPPQLWPELLDALDEVTQPR